MSGNLENEPKIKEKSKFVETFKRFQLLPNASECIPVGPNGSEHAQKPRKTRGNFEKPRENFEKLRENFRKNFFHGAVVVIVVII